MQCEIVRQVDVILVFQQILRLALDRIKILYIFSPPLGNITVINYRLILIRLIASGHKLGFTLSIDKNIFFILFMEVCL